MTKLSGLTLLPTALRWRAARFPFDAARANYATAVQSGLIEPSILASRDFERTLNWLETVTLGPWARQV